MKKKCNENEVILDFKLSEPHSYGFGLITEEVHFRVPLRKFPHNFVRQSMEVEIKSKRGLNPICL